LHRCSSLTDPHYFPGFRPGNPIFLTSLIASLNLCQQAFLVGNHIFQVALPITGTPRVLLVKQIKLHGVSFL
jgi:hypothetical protein